MTPKQ